MSKLTEAVKAKYPQYASVPDDQLERRVLAKYPQYRKLASKNVGDFVYNIGKSGVQAVGDLGGAVANAFNPNMDENTIANLAKLAAGTVQFFDPTQTLGTQYEDRARAVGNFYKNRYGSLDAVGDTLYNDPIGAALDVSTVVTGGAGLAKGVAGVAKAAGAGNVASKAGRVASVLTKAAEVTDPFSLVGKGISKSATAGRRRMIRGFQDTSENLVTRGIGNPVKQAEAARKAGRSVSSFIDQYGLYDRSPDTASKVRRSILQQYDDLALRSGKQISMGQIMQAFDDEIARLSKGVNGVVSEADRAKVAELIKRRDMLLEAAGATYHSPLKAPQRLEVKPDGTLQMRNQPIDPALTEKFVSSVPINVGTDTLTNFRRNVIDPDVPMSQFGLDAKGSGSAQGVKLSRDIVKGAIDSSDPQLNRLGKDYGMAKTMEKIFTDAESRGNNRQIFNFTKLGGAGLGGVVAGAPAALGGFFIEQAVNSPKFISGASKTMREGANLLENEKISRFASSVSKTARPTFTFARVGRVANTNSDQKTPTITSKQILDQPQQRMNQLSPSTASIPPAKSTFSFATPPSAKEQEAVAQLVAKSSNQTKPSVTKVGTNTPFGKPVKLRRSAAY